MTTKQLPLCNHCYGRFQSLNSIYFSSECKNGCIWCTKCKSTDAFGVNCKLCRTVHTNIKCIKVKDSPFNDDSDWSKIISESGTKSFDDICDLMEATQSNLNNIFVTEIKALKSRSQQYSNQTEKHKNEIIKLKSQHDEYKLKIEEVNKKEKQAICTLKAKLNKQNKGCGEVTLNIANLEYELNEEIMKCNKLQELCEKLENEKSPITKRKNSSQINPLLINNSNHNKPSRSIGIDPMLVNHDLLSDDELTDSDIFDLQSNGDIGGVGVDIGEFESNSAHNYMNNRNRQRMREKNKTMRQQNNRNLYANNGNVSQTKRKRTNNNANDLNWKSRMGF